MVQNYEFAKLSKLLHELLDSTDGCGIILHAASYKAARSNQRWKIVQNRILEEGYCKVTAGNHYTPVSALNGVHRSFFAP